MSAFETDSWSLVYRGWDPAQQPLREALCALGNAHFMTRGAAEEARAGGAHYPGTYLAGGYNRLTSEIAGRRVENEDLVNWPNWLVLRFRHPDAAWFDLDEVEVLDYCQALDVRRGVLTRELRFRDADGREATLLSRRIVHMGDPHLAAIEWTLTPHNWSGEIEIDSALDGAVSNDGVARYRALNGRHVEVLEAGELDEEVVELFARTVQSRVEMAQVARTRVFHGEDERPAPATRSTYTEAARVGQRLRVRCSEGRALRVEKVVALYTSRDWAMSEPRLQARKLIARAGDFARLLAGHTLAWSHLWRWCDVAMEDNARTQFVLRFHIFHLLQTVSVNTVDRDVGVPARGWHGEAYRGHIFWDELFIFPFLNLRIPELTRELLLYRFRRLPEARHAARAAGLRGALYPWQSGSDGRDESQVIHLNPRAGEWVPDDTHLQRHVNAAIAYNVWHYFESTGDCQFMEYYGAEMLVEIARLWASLAHYDARRDRYEIHGVVGPDEFHTRYPDAERAGIDNNAYTNVMASWVLECAARALEVIGADRREELLEALHVEPEELASWDAISRRLYVPFHDGDIISQFEGYERLEELDWDGYRAKYGDIHRLDRLLGAEGDAPDRYKASKQADVLMLYFLFSTEQLAHRFAHLGYAFDPQSIPRNIEYYLKRTSHGSTLSRVVHAWVLSRADREHSWRLFREALESDVADIQGSTTPEGIHLGAMAGTVDLAQRCYTGLEVREDVLWLTPRLPKEMRRLRVRMRYHTHWLTIEMNHRRLRVACERGYAGPARIGFDGAVYEVAHGTQREFRIKEPRRRG
ncbi:glycoside hydrolase family 65 protein [Ectothiorhodospiraceae bacterium 2226]|nr:glycoside hydrolase family 65 protein [Ectothiorhodospiraceae bacterium 2226]